MSEESHQEKTEQASPRKLEKSREKGQIAYSADLVAGVSLLATTLTFALFSDHIISGLLVEIRKLLSDFGNLSRDGNAWMVMIVQSSRNVGVVCLPIIGVSFFSTLAFAGILTGFRFSSKPVQLEFDKINPVKGFSKFMSTRSLMRGVMSILKIFIVGILVYWVLRPRLGAGGLMAATSFEQSIEMILELVIWLLIGVAAGLVILGVFDYAFQKWKHLEDMKMTRQEVRNERKDDEGDPQIRARLKRLQREISQRSLMEQVSSATVVVTNPTHFAVCLKYDSTMNAPVVVAKGKDFLALKIIQLAKSMKTPVLERKPLARALYHSVSVGREIPVELFQTVAEVLSYIQSIDRQVA